MKWWGWLGVGLIVCFYVGLFVYVGKVMGIIYITLVVTFVGLSLIEKARRP